MLDDEKLLRAEDFLVKPNQRLELKTRPTKYQGKELDKAEAEILLENGRKHLAEIQDKLYAHNRHSVLIILQGMDASGKDGAVKHILSGMNPQGVLVHSFKAPSAEELDHDYLWRHSLALPRRGEMAIHNRSHYENVLITRVHPEFILREQLPTIQSVSDIKESFWETRFRQIRRFEENLVESGTVVLKFFLHLSKDEQRKRLLERIDDPSKNWKFDLGDLRERGFWDDYQRAYEEALSATSTADAPWFVIPADTKWFARLSIAAIIYRRLQQLGVHYPTISDAQRAELQRAKMQLLSGL